MAFSFLHSRRELNYAFLFLVVHPVNFFNEVYFAYPLKEAFYNVVAKALISFSLVIFPICLEFTSTLHCCLI